MAALARAARPSSFRTVAWLLAGAALAGKDGFAFIKSRIFGFLKSFGPPKTVGRTRYTIGLVMFILPLLFSFIVPYAKHFITGLELQSLVYNIAGDILLLVSLFVLGGDFWDKLRSLFIHDAYAVIPSQAKADDSTH